MKKRQLHRIQVKARELAVEQYLARRCAIVGWECLKLSCANRRGVSDRLIVAYKGVIVFCECKRATGEESALQVSWRKNLRNRGCTTATVYTRQDVDDLMDIIQRGLDGVQTEGLSTTGD